MEARARYIAAAQFEHLVALFLSGPIALVVVLAV
jgi:hypothetical protein